MECRWQGTSEGMTASSVPSNRTLRSLLAASPPHVSMKKALRALIGSLRAAGRRPGASRHTLAGRAGLERVLQAEVGALLEDPDAMEAELARARGWLDVAAELAGLALSPAADAAAAARTELAALREAVTAAGLNGCCAPGRLGVDTMGLDRCHVWPGTANWAQSPCPRQCLDQCQDGGCWNQQGNCA